MYILRPDIPEEEVESHLNKYSDLLKKAGTEVLDNQMRGKRRLAYPISKHKEGIYVQLSHNGNGQQVEILEKAMRLSEDVIRYLTVKQEGPPPTPKPSENKKKDPSQEKEPASDNKKKDTNKEKDSISENKKTDANQEKETKEEN